MGFTQMVLIHTLVGIQQTTTILMQQSRVVMDQALHLVYHLITVVNIQHLLLVVCMVALKLEITLGGTLQTTVYIPT